MAKKILIIDDDAQVRALLQEFLADEGFEIVTADDGWQGLEQLSAHPDLVLLDVSMPKLKGTAVLDRIRSEAFPNWPHPLPVILMTGFWERDTVLAAEKYGVGEFLLKPLDLPDLLKAVRRLLKEDSASR